MKKKEIKNSFWDISQEENIYDFKEYNHCTYILGKKLYAFDVNRRKLWETNDIGREEKRKIEQINQYGIICISYDLSKIDYAGNEKELAVDIIVIGLDGKIRLRHFCDADRLPLPYDVFIHNDIICAPEVVEDEITLEDLRGGYDIYDIAEKYEEEEDEDFNELSKRKKLEYFYDRYFPSGHEVLVRMYVYDLRKETTYYFGDVYLNTEDAWEGIKIELKEKRFFFCIDVYDYDYSLSEMKKVSKIKAKCQRRWINYTTTQKDMENRECVCVSIDYTQNSEERLELYHSLNQELKINQDVIQAFLRKDGYFLCTLPEAFRKNKDWIVFALRFSGRELLERLSVTEWLKNPDFACKAVENCPEIYSNLEEKVKNHPEVITALLSKEAGIKRAGTLLNNREFVFMAVKSVGAVVMNHVNDSLKNDKVLIEELIQKVPIYKIKKHMIGDKLRGDLELLEHALKNAPNHHISTCFSVFDGCKSEKKALMDALRQTKEDGKFSFYLSAVAEELKLDIDILNEVFLNEIKMKWREKFKSECQKDYKTAEELFIDLYKVYPYLLKRVLPDSLRNDRSFVIKMLEFVKEDKEYYRFLYKEQLPLDIADEKFGLDEEIVLESIKVHENQILRVGKELIENDMFLMRLIKANTGVLDYLKIDSSKLEREWALEIAKLDGVRIKIFSNEQKNDVEIAMEAVKNNGIAIKYISEQLQNKKEFVLAAIRSGKHYERIEDGWGYKQLHVYDVIPDAFKEDKDIIIEALVYDEEILSHIPEAFQKDEYVIKAVTKE